LAEYVELLTVLTRAQKLGFLGPGPIEPHVEHADRFLTAWRGDPPGQALDLGSGGGLPGLVLALRWPTSAWTYLDANQRRTAFLAEAVSSLGIADRVDVQRGRAEEVGHDGRLRAQFDLVTARSFGPPAVTAECAAPFLRIGGVLIVSEPPDDPDLDFKDEDVLAPKVRWDGDGLARVGLELGLRVNGCQVLQQREICPTRYSRRVGIPTKRPLF
jgi:16S rRNA (guanine527-N7)-methyltransferase